MTDKEVKQLTKKVNQQKHEISRLIDINNKLKTKLIELKEIGDYQADRIKELTEENEQLEEQLRNLRRLVNEAYMEGSE